MNPKIYLKSRIHMLNSLVRSRIAYSCQTWNCTKTQLNQLNSLYLGFIRRMVTGGYKRKENSWSYVFTNKALLELAQTEDLTSFVRTQQRKYVEQILLRDNENTVKRLLLNDNRALKRGPQASLLSNVLKNDKTTMSDLMKETMERNT